MRAALGVIGLVALLSSPEASAGDASNGRRLFKQHCAACHAIRGSSATSFGPNLKGVVGRVAGSVPDYPYSDALKGAGIKWTEAELDRWIASPQATHPGTAMKFAGLSEPAERADVIAYLVKAGAP